VAATDGFAEFVAERSAGLLRSAWLLTGDAGRAEDLLQTALAAAWLRWPRLAAGNPDAYVRRVLFSTYLSWRRRRWRFEIPSAAPPDADGRGDDVAGAAAQRDLLRRALAGLSRQQRAIVVLRYVEDLSVAETADLVGCSEGTVRVQASRALAALRLSPHVRTDLEHREGVT
jgi:RNA polymerase sigma-70 factor (sigma-E family)